MAALGSRQKGPLTRSLTQVFLQCRQEHNEKKKRFGFGSGPVDAGNQRLLRDDQDPNDEGIEMSHLPPQWVDVVDEANEDIQKIREKLAQLHKAQQKRLLKVFKDDDGPDKDIEIISSAIAGFFRRCEGRIHQIQTKGNDGNMSQKDLALRANVQRSLATELQKLSTQFRKTQKQYLTDLRKRQAGAIWDEETGGKSSTTVDMGFNDSQLLELDNMEVQVGQRSEEISKIAQSISDLHTIFKELAVLVIDQGSILDRIDYNIEQVVHQSKEAHIQLQKAEKAQKSNRALKCIMVLVIADLILIGILIMKHRH